MRIAVGATRGWPKTLTATSLLPIPVVLVRLFDGDRRLTDYSGPFTICLSERSTFASSEDLASFRSTNANSRSPLRRQFWGTPRHRSVAPTAERA